MSSDEEKDILDQAIEMVVELRNRIEKDLNREEANIAVRRNRRYIQRNREEAHTRLVNDYFAEHAIFVGYYFRHRFRMRKSLFMRIVEDVSGVSDYIRQSEDARGTLGFSPLQKCTAALRILAYGTHPDALDESFRMSSRTARESLYEFCRCILLLYKKRYMRRPTPNDIQQLYAHHSSVHNFPGMLGSLDCMHWDWVMCPNALHGQYTKGNKKYPSVVLEAVASQDLWFWHGYFGSHGAINDLNILGNSPIFNRLLDGRAPDTSFSLRGRNFKYGYYLVDGIYYELSVFVKSLSVSHDAVRKRYKRAQEKARKDIERAFGALRKRWQILAKPSHFREEDNMKAVMYTCMILHNMILEDEGNAICQFDENEVFHEPESLAYDDPQYIQNMNILYSSTIHMELRRTLGEHLWSIDNLDLNMPPDDELEGEYSDNDPLL